METGIQVSSLKPLLGSAGQVREAFMNIRRLGCSCVQLQWIDPGVLVAEIAGALRESGLRSVSVQDFFQKVQEDFDYYADLNAATGGQWLTVSRIPPEYQSERGVRAFADVLRATQRRLDGYGQKLAFHPVLGDYQAVPGGDAVAMLMEAIPELELCADLYHLGRWCGDMPAYLRRWPGRIPMVHFKDSKNGQLVPAGQGETNWSGVVKTCLELKIPYAFAEQETWQQNPYTCLQQALNWLNREIGECGHKPCLWVIFS